MGLSGEAARAAAEAGKGAGAVGRREVEVEVANSPAVQFVEAAGLKFANMREEEEAGGGEAAV